MFQRGKGHFCPQHAICQFICRLALPSGPFQGNCPTVHFIVVPGEMKRPVTFSYLFHHIHLAVDLPCCNSKFVFIRKTVKWLCQNQVNNICGPIVCHYVQLASWRSQCNLAYSLNGQSTQRIATILNSDYSTRV